MRITGWIILLIAALAIIAAFSTIIHNGTVYWSPAGFARGMLGLAGFVLLFVGIGMIDEAERKFKGLS